MDTLLAFNHRAAYVGDEAGRPRVEERPFDLSFEQWSKELRADCDQPKHWFKGEKGAPTYHTGGYWYEEDLIRIDLTLELKRFETLSDKSTGLSVRATFLPDLGDLGSWVVADLEEELEDDVESS
jgi:hypothetical protein